MNIKIKDFILIQQEYGFDLKRLVSAKRIGDGTIQNPNGEEYTKEIEIGYNISLPTCIEKIAHLTLLDSNETVLLNRYIDEYKSIVNAINIILKTDGE